MLTTMSKFINKNFLLESKLAEKLYHDVAKNLPIIDYHNHLSTQLISENHQFTDLTSIWLDGDHYKWRAMRALGIEEKYITGNDVSSKDKFLKWAETVPNTLRNPLYHWTHMELSNPFGINKLLNPNSAVDIFEEANQKLQLPSYSSQGLLEHFKVEMLGTTDDPIDNLEHHHKLKNSTFKCKVCPTFRPDKAFNITKADEFRGYIKQLGAVSNVEIKDLESLEAALVSRIDFFDNMGCVASDHGFRYIPSTPTFTKADVNTVFIKVIQGNDNNVAAYEESYGYYLLVFLCQKYYEKEWVQQFHLGAIRNTNTYKLDLLGSDTGYDSIGDYPQAERIAYFFNELEKKECLSKSILYNLNPADNAVFAAMTGNFQGEGIKGKIQYGSAWWFMDQLDGMKDQINTLSNIGVISCFIGMLTDSRSFLSYSRHEYFRRLLCNIFANDINKGILPNDEELIHKVIKDVCYFNAKNYFKNA